MEDAGGRQEKYIAKVLDLNLSPQRFTIENELGFTTKQPKTRSTTDAKEKLSLNS